MTDTAVIVAEIRSYARGHGFLEGERRLTRWADALDAAREDLAIAEDRIAAALAVCDDWSAIWPPGSESHDQGHAELIAEVRAALLP